MKQAADAADGRRYVSDSGERKAVLGAATIYGPDLEANVRPLLGRLVICGLLFTAAAIAFAQARVLRASADRHERIATLRSSIGGDEEGAGVLSTWLPFLPRPSRRSPTADRATADYWQGRYDMVSNLGSELDRDPDPELLLIAANAAFRASQQTPQVRSALVQQLDVVLQAYATALKSGLSVSDAAYNYEYVARLRDAASRQRAPADRKATADVPSVDLPAGPTIHGRPGGPPPGTKGEEFEILTPMEFGDRESQPEPNAGRRPLRKG